MNPEQSDLLAKLPVAPKGQSHGPRGLCVGLDVGFLVGLLVGGLVGCLVGPLVGLLVGFLVGLMVAGATVETWQHSASPYPTPCFEHVYWHSLFSIQAAFWLQARSHPSA